MFTNGAEPVINGVIKCTDLKKLTRIINIFGCDIFGEIKISKKKNL
jgi:hypothetical protein